MKQKSSTVSLKSNLEPKGFICFRCKNSFKINHNNAIGMSSQKNYWLYWTDESWDHKEMRRKPKNERGDKICDNCLKTVYFEKEWELLDQIKNKSRRQTLASYIYHRII